MEKKIDRRAFLKVLGAAALAGAAASLTGCGSAGADGEKTTIIRVAFNQPELPQLPKDMNILHISQVGRVYTYIVRGNPAEIKSRMAALSPILLEVLPLSLEEIFIYELGGEDYGVRDIVL